MMWQVTQHLARGKNFRLFLVQFGKQHLVLLRVTFACEDRLNLHLNVL